MKRTLFLIMVMTSVLCMGALAQQEVTGRVTSQSDGLPIPGVNVSEKGTTNGTITDMEGTYKLTVSQDGATLVFSFIGMETQEILVNGLSSINVNLAESAFQMDEVVVTALGIKRQEKTLTYAQQTVGADELLKARDPNFMNSLSGKASGVEIKKSSSGAGGSTKIELRGSKSLSGTSDPLFVIDGIPMANNKGGQPGMWGGTDQGDGLSQINPDDIESLTILKGSNAAALYGSQGANGVVVITTKKGKKGTTKVNVSSGLTFEKILLQPDLQYKYGSTGGAKESWSYTAGDYASNYVDDFFQTGTNAVNTVSISGGNDRTTAYFSYGNTSAKGIVPTNTYLRNNITLKQSTKLFNDKLTISSNVMLTSEKSKNRQPAGYYLNPLTGLYFFPRDKDFSDYKENYQVFDEDRNMYLQNWFISDHHQSNPYWILHNQPKTDNTKRLIANMVLDYEISDALKFQVRGNYDFANKSFEQQHAAGSNTTNVHKNGRWDYQKYTDELMYTDGILTFDKKLGNFSLNGVVGASYQKYTYGKGVSVNTGTDGLLYPNEFFFQNIAFNVQVKSTLGSRLIKEAVFANAQVGFKDMIFLDVSGRNDWASSLAGTGNQSYFYPAVGITTLVNEMVDLPAFVTFGKLRASWSQVGNEVPFNKVDPQNTITSGGGISRNTTKPFTDLNPEMISSFEVGADWRFLNGRLGFDLTYYNIISTDQFVQLEAPSGSGYTYYYVNAGEINNNGIELSIDATPVKNSNFSWKTALNYSKNNNEVVEIHPQVSGLTTGSSEGYDNKFVEGGSIGDIYVYKFRRDDQGRILLSNSTGAPLKTSVTEKIGNLNPDWSLGWSNSLNYKNLSLGFLVNGKIGGKAVSQTEAMLDGYGVSQRTADARDAGSVSINGVTESGTAVTSIDPKLYYTTTGDRNGIKEPYTYDRTNIRISQVSLSYSFDVKEMNLPIDNATLSFVGQNLLFLYKDAPFDPELVMSTGSSYQSLDNFNLPSTRTYGFNLQVTF